MKKGFGFLFLVFLILIQLSFISAGIVFESEWNNSLGTNDTALLDGGVWNHVSGSGTLNEVIVTTDLDFPTANVFRVTASYSGNPVQEIYTDQVRAGPAVAGGGPLPVPNVGESLYYRWYWRTLINNSIPNQGTSHPIQDSLAAGNTNWWFDPNPQTNGKWIPRISVNSNAQNAGGFRFWDSSTPLDKNVTYRVEMQIHRINTSTFNLHLRIYNSSNALILDDDDFHGQDASSGVTLATNPTLNFYIVNNLADFQVGTNGPGWVVGAENFPFPMWDIGAICIRDDDWCGAYNTSNQSQQNDTTPPVRSAGSPSGLFPFNTTQATLSLTTNEAATCRYGTTPGTAYASIANNFTTTGSTSHSQLISGLTFNTTYNYYVRCNDTAGNVNTNDFNITFRISHAPNFTYNWNEWWINETTNFTMFNASYLQNIANVRFVNQYGRIQFLQGLNLSSDLDLTNRIKVLDKKVWINSSLIPEFNRSAQLTFTGVGFSNPIVKIDGVDCPITVCQNVTFNQTTGTYSVNVTSFSMYEVVEQCEDGIRNYDETGKDCGGKCGECGKNYWVWVLIGVLAIGIVMYLFGKKR